MNINISKEEALKALDIIDEYSSHDTHEEYKQWHKGYKMLEQYINTPVLLDKDVENAINLLITNAVEYQEHIGVMDKINIKDSEEAINTIRTALSDKNRQLNQVREVVKKVNNGCPQCESLEYYKTVTNNGDRSCKKCDTVYWGMWYIEEILKILGDDNNENYER